MITLRDLIDDHDGTGAIVDNAGNGSAGPLWLEWDAATDLDYGDVVMRRVASDRVARELYEGQGMTIGDTVYISEWIVIGEGDNPYRYRLLF